MIRLDIQNFCKECANREICKWFSKVDEENLKSCQGLYVDSINFLNPDDEYIDQFGNHKSLIRNLSFANISEDDPHFELVMKVMKCNRFQSS